MEFLGDLTNMAVGDVVRVANDGLRLGYMREEIGPIGRLHRIGTWILRTINGSGELLYFSPAHSLVT